MNTENIISELELALAKAKEASVINRYDFSDEVSIKKLRDYIEALFRDRVRLIKDYTKTNGLNPIEYTYETLERRKTAVFNISREIQSKNGLIYNNMSAAEEFVNLSAPVYPISFSELEKRYHVEFAAAIWILDYLKYNGKLDEALSFFPEKRENLNSVQLPDIIDSVHSDDLIRGMMFIIHNRNSESGTVDSSVPLSDADSVFRPLSNNSISSHRSSYEAIVHLIDTDTICDTRDKFITLVRKTIEALLLIINRCRNEIHQQNIKKSEIINEQLSRYYSYNPETDNDRESLKASLYNTLETIRDIDIKIRNNEYRIEELYFYNDIESVRDTVYKICVNSGYNPYSLCFGFLNLLGTDSDVIRIYNIPYMTLSAVCGDLLWYDDCIDKSDDERNSDLNPDFTNSLIQSGDIFSESAESIFDRKYAIPPFGKSCDPKISFTKLVYQLSGIVPPRTSSAYAYTKALMNGDDLSSVELDIMKEYIALACSVAKRDDYIFIDDDDDKNDDEVQSDSSDAEDVKRLKRENKSLKALINKLEHRLKESDNSLRSTTDALNASAAELAELRSMIRESGGSDEASATTVAFPYTSKKRAVVFGGHESWSKAIKSLLNNVRFVEASAQPNTSLIMNADVVWIQTNAIGHSSFYKIIDVIRKHNIELRYFKYSSAEKCAEQFALDDSEAESAEDNKEIT